VQVRAVSRREVVLKVGFADLGEVFVGVAAEDSEHNGRRWLLALQGLGWKSDCVVLKLEVVGCCCAIAGI
jgi:hypothetical protein